MAKKKAKKKVVKKKVAKKKVVKKKVAKKKVAKKKQFGNSTELLFDYELQPEQETGFIVGL